MNDRIKTPENLYGPRQKHRELQSLQLYFTLTQVGERTASPITES